MQQAAIRFGVAFLIVGLAGFIPVLTLDISAAAAASGAASEAALAASLQVSLLQNIMHLIFGIVGVVAARSVRASMIYLLAGGVALWLYARTGTMQSVVTFMPFESGGDWLHLILGAAMIASAVIALVWRRGEGADASGRAGSAAAGSAAAGSAAAGSGDERAEQ